jgi:hypothetical protein
MTLLVLSIGSLMYLLTEYVCDMAYKWYCNNFRNHQMEKNSERMIFTKSIYIGRIVIHSHG